MNLSLESYSKHELMKLFSLKPGFDSKCVQTGKDKLTRQLRTATGIDTQQKLDIQFFIDNATSLLIGFIEDELNVSREKGTWMQKKNTMLSPNNNHFVIAEPGWLNPINCRTITTCFNIDSRFRNSYTSSDFQVELPVVQKNVIRSKIVNVDIPISFYGVSRERGNATFIITEIDQRSSSTLKDSAINESPINIESSELNYDSHTGQWSQDFVQLILKLHPCFSRCDVDYIPNIHSLIDQTDPNNKVAYRVNHLSNWEASKFFVNPVFSFGWLVILPDGNYECSWQESNNSADLVYSMNNALTTAVPGILFHSDGTFLTYRLDVNMPIHTIDYGINTTYDMTYNVDRVSGRSVLNVPAGVGSVFISGNHITSDLNYPLNIETGQWRGVRVKFAVNSGGSISLAENIQLRLGWQLGFREADYMRDEIMSLVSEGIAMIISPRYLFLSIDDGLKSSNTTLVPVPQSMLSEHIMAKINIAQPLDNVGVYKSCGKIDGINQAREYFGSGTITRLKIKLIDEHGRELSLNNMDWSMSIVFTKLYE